MNFLIARKKDFQLSQRWVMLYFSGAWSQMELQIHQVYTVSSSFIVTIFYRHMLVVYVSF
jgi:hypothetical protein